MSTDAAQRVQQAERALGAGRIDDAERMLREALAAEPNHAGAHRALAICGLMRGDLTAADPHATRASELSPNDGGAWGLLTAVRLGQRRYAEARDAGERAARLAPRLPESWVGLGRALRGTGEDELAIKSFKKAIALAPKRTDAAAALAEAQLHDADAAGAVDLLGRASKLSPGDATLASLLALTMQYDARPTPAERYAAHGRYASIIEGGLSPDEPPIDDPDPDRPLRVGVISPDLRRHSVAFFARPFIERLGGLGMPIVCFNDSPNADAMTEQLRAASAGWHDVRGKPDNEVDPLIRSERIDVLIDLAGHTAGNRLQLLARRPAPVLVTMIGYPATTGLSRVDARIVDSLTDPPGSDDQASERLVRIDPCFLCYSRDDDAPEPSDPPSDAPFTFCSFNDLKKYAPPLLEAWATILRRVSGSKLLVKTRPFDAELRRRRFVERLESLGAPPGSVEALGPTEDPADHLKLYAGAHLALDTFPYHGTTTTCEAALMGVPTLTLAGDTHASRVGVSLNHALRRDSLVADSFEAYIDRAVEIAGNPGELAALRLGLRDELLTGVLGDPDAYAARLANAIRELWRARVGGRQGS